MKPPISLTDVGDLTYFCVIIARRYLFLFSSVETLQTIFFPSCRIAFIGTCTAWRTHRGQLLHTFRSYTGLRRRKPKARQNQNKKDSHALSTSFSMTLHDNNVSALIASEVSSMRESFLIYLYLVNVSLWNCGFIAATSKLWRVHILLWNNRHDPVQCFCYLLTGSWGHVDIYSLKQWIEPDWGGFFLGLIL